MKSVTALILLFVFSNLSAGNWLGLKTTQKPTPQASTPNQARKAIPVAVDTTYLSRKITVIPSTTSGDYLGILAGVRCFNCVPNVVLLNLEDSISTQVATLSLRVEVWNNIERPLKERRIFDHDNRCFYFAHKAIDTIFIGGEWNELRAKEMPCYPYLQRTVNLIRDTLSATPITLDQNE